MSEATALPTEPPPLPYLFLAFAYGAIHVTPLSAII